MKAKRATREEKHCWTHGVDDWRTGGSQSGVQGQAGDMFFMLITFKRKYKVQNKLFLCLRVQIKVLKFPLSGVFYFALQVVKEILNLVEAAR